MLTLQAGDLEYSLWSPVMLASATRSQCTLRSSSRRWSAARCEFSPLLEGTVVVRCPMRAVHWGRCFCSEVPCAVYKLQWESDICDAGWHMTLACCCRWTIGELMWMGRNEWTREKAMINNMQMMDRKLAWGPAIRLNQSSTSICSAVALCFTVVVQWIYVDCAHCRADLLCEWWLVPTCSILFWFVRAVIVGLLVGAHDPFRLFESWVWPWCNLCWVCFPLEALLDVMQQFSNVRRCLMTQQLIVRVQSQQHCWAVLEALYKWRVIGYMTVVCWLLQGLIGATYS